MMSMPAVGGMPLASPKRRASSSGLGVDGGEAVAAEPVEHRGAGVGVGVGHADGLRDGEGPVRGLDHVLLREDAGGVDDLLGVVRLVGK